MTDSGGVAQVVPLIAIMGGIMFAFVVLFALLLAGQRPLERLVSRASTWLPRPRFPVMAYLAAMGGLIYYYTEAATPELRRNMPAVLAVYVAWRLSRWFPPWWQSVLADEKAEEERQQRDAAEWQAYTRAREEANARTPSASSERK